MMRRCAFKLLIWIYRALRWRWSKRCKYREAKFRLKLKDLEIEDLTNRLEAYKDALAAITREYRLQGMLAEADLERIIRKKAPRSED